jgi:hypothetical protein
MSADGFENSAEKRSDLWPPVLNPVALPPSEVIQPSVGDPCSSGDPEEHQAEPKALIVRGQTADQRSRLLGDDARRAERDVRPELMENVRRVPMRRRNLQQPKNGRRSGKELLCRADWR